MMSDRPAAKTEIFEKARKEVLYLGITDTIFSTFFLASVAGIGGVLNFSPHIVFWLFILFFHAIHVATAATLVAGNVKKGNNSTKLAVCNCWLLYCRYILRFFFPLECILVMSLTTMFAGDNDNDLIFMWILFIIVEELFLYLAILSIHSFVNLLHLPEAEEWRNDASRNSASPSTSANITCPSTTASADPILP